MLLTKPLSGSLQPPSVDKMQAPSLSRKSSMKEMASHGKSPTAIERDDKKSTKRVRHTAIVNQKKNIAISFIYY